MTNKILERLTDKLTLSKIKGYESIDGFLSPVEAIELYKIAQKLPQHSVIVEIGAWKGKSSYCLAKGLKSGKILAIDPFDASGDSASAEVYANNSGKDSIIMQYKHNMSRLGVAEKIEILQGWSNDFVGKIPRIDFLFIDGDHSKDGCDFDFINYSSCIPKGGYIALHDFYPSRMELGPTWVVHNRILPFDDFEFVSLAGSLWVARKK
jgi:MMP 1-O-methyltransferase